MEQTCLVLLLEASSRHFGDEKSRECFYELLGGESGVKMRDLVLKICFPRFWYHITT